MEKSVHERKNKIRYTFSIFDKRKNQYAVSTSYLNISNSDSRIEIGATWIGKEFQRSGLKRNYKFLLLSFASEDLNALQVELKTHERNTVSRNAIPAIGAKSEGILRSHTLMYDGYRRNRVYYSILKEKWEKMKENFLKEK